VKKRIRSVEPVVGAFGADLGCHIRGRGVTQISARESFATVLMFGEEFVHTRGSEMRGVGLAFQVQESNALARQLFAEAAVEMGANFADQLSAERSAQKFVQVAGGGGWGRCVVLF